jgi:hypothetical protein
MNLQAYTHTRRLGIHALAFDAAGAYLANLGRTQTLNRVHFLPAFDKHCTKKQNEATACTGTRLPNYHKVLTYVDTWFRIIQLLHKT